MFDPMNLYNGLDLDSGGHKSKEKEKKNMDCPGLPCVLLFGR